MKTRKAETTYQPKCTEVLANGNVCGNTHLLSDSKCSIHWKQPATTNPQPTPGPWIKSFMHEATRTPEEVAHFAGPNAGYVLRAVNAHEDLLEALKNLLRFKEGTPEILGAKAIAERLIAKAGGR